MGTLFRWPRTGRDQYWDLVNTAMNLQIRERTRNLWHNRVQSAQECYLLLHFNINVMIYPVCKVKRSFCVSESGSPRFGTGFWYSVVTAGSPVNHSQNAGIRFQRHFCFIKRVRSVLCDLQPDLYNSLCYRRTPRYFISIVHGKVPTLDLLCFVPAEKSQDF